MHPLKKFESHRQICKIQFFGKSNDPDTSKFYESYFELVKESTKSVSQKGDIFSSGKTTTIGEKDVSKFRASRFNNLKVGEFAMLSDGKNDIFNFKALPIITELMPEQEAVSTQMLNNNFSKILNDVKTLLK